MAPILDVFSQFCKIENSDTDTISIDPFTLSSGVSRHIDEGQVAVSGVGCLSIVRGDCRLRFDVHASPEAVAGLHPLKLA